MSKRTSEWEEKFDKMIFEKKQGYGDQILYREKDIKSFISDLLAKEKMELVEEAVKLFAEHLLTLKDGTHDIRSEARRFIKSFSFLKSEIQEKEEVGG